MPLPLNTALKAPWRVRTPWLLDQSGRVIILRGVNLAYKKAPFYPPDLSYEDLWALKQWGFSVIRLAIFWEAIEPEPGQYNLAYLVQIQRIIDWAAQCGIYVLVDMHQDLFSVAFGGVGAPRWAVRDRGLTFRPTTQHWALNYYSGAVSAAFEEFWQDPQLQRSFAETWRVVIRSVGQSSNVLGFDLFNEPWSGPSPLPASFERRVLTGFYLRLMTELLPDNPDRLFTVGSAFLVGAGAPGGLGPLPGIPNVGYAFHAYALTQRVMIQARDRVISNGWTSLLGEFGASDDLKALETITAQADCFNLGWCYWTYCSGPKPTILDEPTGEPEQLLLQADGTPRPKIQYLARIYALALAGTPQKMHYEPRTGRFYLFWHPDPALDVPTHIVIPSYVKERFYGKGLRWQGSEGLTVLYEPEWDHLLVYCHTLGTAHLELSPR